MTELATLDPGFSWRVEGLEWPVVTDVGAGLAGVVAGETRVVWLDPSSGMLCYRGVPIEDLTVGSDFEEAAHLLITGREAAEDAGAFVLFRDGLRSSRRLPSDVVALVRDLEPGTHPTRVLRAGISALGCHELAAGDDLAGDRHWRELRTLGQVVGVVAELACHRRGRPSPAPPPGESLAEGLLGALNGRQPAPHEVRALDLVWTLYAAHGLDAPTFTSIIVASTLADPYYNVVAGLSALRGPRFGGAGERVVEQLLALPSAAAAGAWVESTLASGGVIAGFGHREYRMPDPRVVTLRKTCASLARRGGRGELFDRARAVEEEASRRLAAKGVYVNINLYGALALYLLGAAADEVPVLVAAARTAGLVALVRESLESIRLVRPLSRYVGPGERRLEERRHG